MSVESSLSGDNKSLVVKITDRFDFSLQNDFRNSYQNNSDNVSEVTIDMTQAEYMDSSALGMLLLMKQFMDSRNASITIKPSEPIKKILEIAKFDQLFTVC